MSKYKKLAKDTFENILLVQSGPGTLTDEIRDNASIGLIVRAIEKAVNEQLEKAISQLKNQSSDTIEHYGYPECAIRILEDLTDCQGVIPDTFIMCGEEGNYCSSKCMREASKK